MVIPVPATLPDSTLAPSALTAKFSSLSGLGDDDEAEGGNSVHVGPASPSYWDLMTGAGITPQGWAGEDGGYTGRGSGSASTSTSSSSTDWSGVMRALIQGGVDITKLTVVTPGTTQTAGGISRQNPGYAIPGTNSASIGVNSNSSGSMLMVLGLAAAAFFFMNRNR
jgi:hypothetical protein